MVDRKNLGQYYTPAPIVNLILDAVIPESNGGLIGMRLCDPACGDGAFLVEVARRILDRLDEKDALEALARLDGFDIDPQAVADCKANLKCLLAEYYPHASVEWRIFLQDSTRRANIERRSGFYSHVVGNPPYVRVQNIAESERKRLTSEWSMLTGAYDLYIVFFEVGLELLAGGGMLGYITPLTWMRASAGKELRRRIVEHNTLLKVIDFGSKPMFERLGTYTAITLLRKGGKTSKIALSLYGGTTGQMRLKDDGVVVRDTGMPTSAWAFTRSEEDADRLVRLRARGDLLGDVADVLVGIQTSANKVFILSEEDAEAYGLEGAMLRTIIKPHPANHRNTDADSNVVIYPYDQHGQLIPETTLRRLAPEVYRYLLRHYEVLSRRVLDKSAGGWYAYGRSQSILTSFGEKILVPMMCKRPAFFVSRDARATFHSGFAIKPKNGVDIDALCAALNSDDMHFFMKHTSQPYRDGWLSYKPTYIKQFPLPAGFKAVQPKLEGAHNG